jgi:excisionase family DNA binding protein
MVRKNLSSEDFKKLIKPHQIDKAPLSPAKNPPKYDGVDNTLKYLIQETWKQGQELESLRELCLTVLDTISGLSQEAVLNKAAELDRHKEMISVASLAKKLHLTRPTIYRMIKSGEIPAVHIGTKFFVSTGFLNNLQPERAS